MHRNRAFHYLVLPILKEALHCMNGERSISDILTSQMVFKASFSRSLFFKSIRFGVHPWTHYVFLLTGQIAAWEGRMFIDQDILLELVN